MEQKKLLIADDSEVNRAILANMLDRDFTIIEASNGREVISTLQAYHGEISALLLDIVMPEMDGFEVLEEMKRHHWLDEIPVIMISAETGSAYIDRAFELGASDYISRPFATGIIRRRIINTILLHTKKQQLMDVVSSRFYRREKSSSVMVSILDYAMEVRSGDGGTHMSGVSYLTGVLLHRLLEKTDRYGLNSDDVDVICMASSLHDIGKLLIPEEILKKPGKLTPEEFDIVKHHPQLGVQIIEQLPVHQNERMVHYATEICRWHHERWNGEGYPDGLKGDQIPIAAQVVSLADAYDALTSKRSYKNAYSHETAMAMIHNGECGSFNPLLLQCLDDASEEIRHGAAAGGRKDPHAAHRVVEELYRGEDPASARMGQQLEEAYIKQNFFTSLSGEMWFEYNTAQPSTLYLSRGVTEQTGLAPVTVSPLEDEHFREIVHPEMLDKIRGRLKELSLDEPYVEIETTVTLGGKPRRCQLSVLVLRTAPGESEGYTGLFGKITDIDERCGRLEAYHAAAEQKVERQVLVPVGVDADGVLHITREQAGPVLQSYRSLFQTVRLVDPHICMQVSSGSEGEAVSKSKNCYALWGKTQRCKNCISQETVRTRKAQNKVEVAGSEVYLIQAMCVEVDGVPYALECVNPIQAENMVGDEEENILNQLLVRNRQVYIDSVTKVFNRRYYDDRLRKLVGEHALAMLDIDDFKQINDRFGHQAGDEALYCVAQTIRSILRSSDDLVRYGGDEFCLLFYGLPEQVLERKLQAVCRAVSKIELPEYPELRLSVSIGGVYAAGRIPDLVRRADLALYQAKVEKGRVCIFKEESHDAQ